jgi:hypothetical protein
VPKLLIWVVNSSGNETLLSPSEEDNVTIIASHMLTSTFIPANAGVYNVSAVAQDEQGNTLTNPDNGQPVLVRTNFTVLDARPPSSGIMKTFNMDKDVVARKGAVYIEYFSLPQDAVIYSAVLEITDAHIYETRTAGAQASYYLQQSYTCQNPSADVFVLQVKSSTFSSQQGSVEIPANSFINSASYSKNQIDGQMTVYVNGVSIVNPISADVVKPGINTISISMPYTVSCSGSQAGYPFDGYYLSGGDATLAINYDTPAAETADPSAVTGINVNGNSISSNSVVDISQYMKAGQNTFSFGAIQGIFHYKLVVNYA